MLTAHALDELIVIGDRVLIRPDDESERTAHGLYLPQTVTAKEQVQSGVVLKTGPGIPVADLGSIGDEPWKTHRPEAPYVPLQARVGDRAIFLRNAAVEIVYEGATYLVVTHSAILVLQRNGVDAALGEMLED